MSRRISDVLLMALLAIFACGPLFYPGFFFGQSGLASVYNLADFQQNASLSWRPGFGLGSFGDFTLLPYYVGALLLSVGLSDTGTVKLLYGIGFILSSVGSYALVKSLLGVHNPASESDTRLDDVGALAGRTAILSGVLYTYLPYHLASTYVRADLGESLAFGLAPWAGICLCQVIRRAAARDEQRDSVTGTASRGLLMWLALSLLAVVSLMLTLPGVGLVVLFLLAGAALAKVDRLTERLPVMSSAVAAVPFVVGLLMSWPLALPISPVATPVGGAEASPAIEFSRLFSPVWVEGLGLMGGFPVQIGLVAGALALLSFVPGLSFASEAGDRGLQRLAKYLQAVLVIVVALMLPLLSPAWPVLRLLVGEPFRLLFVLALPLSLLAGSMLLRKGFAHPLVSVSLIMMVVLGSYSYISPRFGSIDEPSHVLAARFGEDIVLLDYQLAPAGSAGSSVDVAKGGEVRLRLVWQALRTPKEDLTVFTHLLDSSERMHGQHDSPPSNGTRTTRQWQAGDIIVDDHVLRIDPDTPTGDSVIEVGMYVPTTGTRVPVTVRGRSDVRLVLAGPRVNE